MAVILDTSKTHAYNGMTHIERARHIAKTLGVRQAAKYLRNRSWSIEATMFILLGK